MSDVYYFDGRIDEQSIRLRERDNDGRLMLVIESEDDLSGIRLDYTTATQMRDALDYWIARKDGSPAAPEPPSPTIDLHLPRLCGTESDARALVLSAVADTPWSQIMLVNVYGRKTSTMTYAYAAFIGQVIFNWRKPYSIHGMSTEHRDMIVNAVNKNRDRANGL